MEKSSALSSFFGGVKEMKDWNMENKQDNSRDPGKGTEMEAGTKISGRDVRANGRFGAGVLTGVLVAVVLICGVMGNMASGFRDNRGRLYLGGRLRSRCGR